MSFAGKWIELEIIMLSKTSQTQKDRHHMFQMWNLKSIKYPGVVVQVCDLSYLRYQEDCSLRPAQARTSQEPISTNGWAQWHAPVIQAMHGNIKRKIVVQAGSGIKQDPISKITNAKGLGL
jgi:hypothetical protein